MEKRKKELIIGSLFHDIGKLVYRTGENKSHEESGANFLKNRLDIENINILEQVRYHHGETLRKAFIGEDSLAYITYIADNIAAGMDRRKTENEEGFQRTKALESVFNILNNNDEKKSYTERILDIEDIPYPKEGNVEYSAKFYRNILNEDIIAPLKEHPLEDLSCNSILKQLEKCLTYIPSSTVKNERADISLYDHVKVTAAISSCILDYLDSKKITSYKEELYKRSQEFYNKNVFLLYSLDISGIQSFIYTTSSKGELKALRFRSFYLEILMEYAADELLNRLELSRANLLYLGGGHAYFILPNIKKVQDQLEQYEAEWNRWFLDVYQTELFVAGAFQVCSANKLKNNPDGSYSELFQKLSRKLSEKKGCRYTAQQIIQLNSQNKVDGERECKSCHRVGKLYENKEKGEYKCEICTSIEKMSPKVVKENMVFALNKVENKLECLPMPFGRFLHVISNQKEDWKDYDYVYQKNQMTLEDRLVNIWVGDYRKRETFAELANASQGLFMEKEKTGIRRLAVLRADVDNLGHAFTLGFQHKNYGGKYATISRTATFSRKMSMFFKLYINQLLKNGHCYINEKIPGEREAAIVYSGGDDVFIVGSWDDIIGFAVDLYDGLKRYTQGTLTISAGIGLYPEKYPISVMARETGELEECSKNMDGKNAITLFSEDNTYHWDVFIEKVLGEKLELLKQFFTTSQQYGKSFLYHLLELLKNQEEPINLARYAYLLSRMEPGESASKEEKQQYQEFSQKMYEWRNNKEDTRQVITAITLYAYLIRSREENEENE